MTVADLPTPSYVRTRRCRSQSKFGKCGRDAGHDGPHGVPIGDRVWFAYLTTRTTSRPVGYGYFDGDIFDLIGAAMPL